MMPLPGDLATMILVGFRAKRQGHGRLGRPKLHSYLTSVVIRTNSFLFRFSVPTRSLGRPRVPRRQAVMHAGLEPLPIRLQVGIFNFS
jgi:hypothetical protein